MTDEAGMEKHQLSQVDYEERPYEDSSWELVGEGMLGVEFLPLEMDVVSSAAHIVDPMFADYGGVPDEDVDRRWHLPEELSYRTPEHIKRQQVVEEEPTQRLTEEEIEAIRQEAYQQGLADGEKAATEALAERYGEIENRTINLFQDLKTQLEENIQQCEKQGVSLALAISEKLVGHAVEINPEYIVGIITEGIALAGAADIKRIRVSPEDFEFIELVGLTTHIQQYDGSWEFAADETINSGCILETTAGELDFQLDVAWKRVKNKVIRVIR